MGFVILNTWLFIWLLGGRCTKLLFYGVAPARDLCFLIPESHAEWSREQWSSNSKCFGPAVDGESHRLRQGDLEIEASLRYIERPCFKSKQKVLFQQSY
jgi:hypothetical protein